MVTAADPATIRSSLLAAFSIVALPLPAGVRLALGEAHKHPASPLFAQDRPWEQRCDNAYPNVHQREGSWKMWYGCSVAGLGFDVGEGTNRSFALLFARSRDGLAWHKPNLGIYNLSAAPEASVNPWLRRYGVRNNIVAGHSDGVGVVFDEHEGDKSRQYKAFGSGCFGPGGAHDCVEGVASSADGLHWHGATNVSWPPPHRYDDHNNVFWDEEMCMYVFTTRVMHEPGVRSIGMARTPRWPPTTRARIRSVLRAQAELQHYSAVSWKWHNAYLALVSVWDVPARLIAPHLAASRDGLAWGWVGEPPRPGGKGGRPFVPAAGVASGRFDSHIVFPAKPVRAPEQGEERVYYAGGNGEHNGPRNTSLGLATLRPDGFVALSGSGTVFTRRVLCTAAELTVSADTDVPGEAGAYVQIGAQPSAEWTAGQFWPSADLALPIRGRNVTDEPVLFGARSRPFEALIGRKLVLEIRLRGARVFTVGFREPTPRPGRGGTSEEGRTEETADRSARV